MPRNFWADEVNVQDFLRWVAAKCGVAKWEDWYNVSTLEFQRLGGATLLSKYGGMCAVLKKMLPSHPWKETAFSVPATKWGKSQWHLLQTVKQMLVGNSYGVKEGDIKCDYKHPDLVYQDSKFKMELDIFVPVLNLAFEYNGQQHFQPHYVFGSCSLQQKRDEEKKKACNEAGITLIEVPFWWDYSRSSLVASVLQQRPELVLSSD